MFVNDILSCMSSTELIMDVDRGEYKVCIRVNGGDDIVDHPVYVDERGNRFIVVGSVFNTNGYLNQYGGAILMDLYNAGITLADVLLVPEFMPDTWYSIGLDEWDDIMWITHEPDPVDHDPDEVIAIESWI